MTTLKSICLNIIQVAKRIMMLPRTMASAAEHRRQRSVLNEFETERLDRIRNPSKYQGR